MSSFENETLRDLRSGYIAEGEIVSVTGDTVTIAGDFSPGMTISLPRGARVFILTADEAIDWCGPSDRCSGCEL